MSSTPRKQDKSPNGAPFGARQLHVRNLPYDNTAAKFWTCLLDEVAHDCPECTKLVLAASTGGPLGPDLLSPTSALQRDMESLNEEDVMAAFQDAMAALEIIGPPCTVQLRLFAGDKEMTEHAIDLEYLDAELLPFLLVWLLEWAEIPEVFWDRERIGGTFVADDRERGYRYTVRFALESRHLNEGLYHRVVEVIFHRMQAQPSPPEAVERR